MQIGISLSDPRTSRVSRSSSEIGSGAFFLSSSDGLNDMATGFTHGENHYISPVGNDLPSLRTKARGIQTGVVWAQFAKRAWEHEPHALDTATRRSVCLTICRFCISQERITIGRLTGILFIQGRLHSIINRVCSFNKALAMR